jgi:carbonic anhydrase
MDACIKGGKKGCSAQGARDFSHQQRLRQVERAVDNLRQESTREKTSQPNRVQFMGWSFLAHRYPDF